MNVFVMIPTYNEKENIERLISEIVALNISGLSIVIVDDNSPDGTHAMVENMAQKDDRIHLIKRMKRRGRGSAGIEGFKYSLSKGAEYVIEMDADFSHHPRYIPQFLDAIATCDVAIGSRFIRGGMDRDRGLYRQFVTKLAGAYVRSILKIPIRDVSSGFRCFRKNVLEAIDLDDMISTGPSIVLEILYKASLEGFTLKEMPIVFSDRRQGETKLDHITLLETMVMVLRLKQLKKKGLL